MPITRKDVAMAATGALDPVLAGLASKLAESVPRTSVMHSKAFELAMGVLKGFIESFSSQLSMPAHVVVEKLTDFSDFFVGALRMSHGDEMKFLDRFEKEFFVEVQKRLGNTSDIALEKQRLEAEMELRLALVSLTTKSKRKASAMHKTFHRSFGTITRELEILNRALHDRLQNRRTKRRTIVKQKAPASSHQGEML